MIDLRERKMCPARLPKALRTIPPELASVMEPAGPDEISEANSIRADMFLDDASGAYMVDIVRAFRVVRLASIYIEVGTRDKGNIAWISKFLKDNATIVDVDLVQIERAKSKLQKHLNANQSIHFIEGNSIDLETAHAVARVLRGRKADAIFLDSSHMYDHVLAEIDTYWDFLKPGGVLLIHDIFWEGTKGRKGKAQAAEFIDRHLPVYVVSENDPVSRFIPRGTKSETWGGVGIILKSIDDW